MSAIPNFLESPDYLSLFMIWASGYIFAFVVFRGSRVWKEIDSTMKLVVAMILGFVIEFCVILPLFYLNFQNVVSTGLFIPAFNSTWLYHGMLTLIISVIALKSRKLMLGF
jgi:hypothetical protein